MTAELSTILSPQLLARVHAAQQAANPLLEAARVLLDALSNTPVELDAEGTMQYRQKLLLEVNAFDQICANIWAQPQHVETARYCLCSALDEAAMQTRWGNDDTRGSDWSVAGLAASLGYDRQGGDKVFRIIDETMREPQANHDLIELLYNLLNLGFHGRYRFEAGGRDRLRTIMAGLQRASKAVVASPVSGGAPPALTYPQPPQSATPPAVIIGRNPPPAPSHHGWQWFALSLLIIAAIIGATYLGYRAREYETQAPVLDTLALRLKDRLRSEIAANTASLTPNASHTRLTLSFSDMFAPGETVPNPWVSPLIATAGAEIAKLPLQVTVIGYTDNEPLGNKPYVSNRVLSTARADTVRHILLAAGVPTERIQIQGKGDADPVANNTTGVGRTKNRRVELDIEKIDGL